MIRDVVLHPDPILRAPCAPADEATDDLARDLIETMYAAEGRGLAAPQIGVSRRVFVMDCTWKEGVPDPRIFVNPEIVARAGRQVNVETCLSIPDRPRRLARPAEVTLVFDGPGGRQREAFTGFAAACVCHEMDHLDGVLVLDRPEEPA
ncbi:peptide deformylase [Jannaschia marina]|uniref:peptide deformylase n=1 Tax=Jannaschia marina TaxID=2741674 RepID=UPI0015CD1B35|nr:peptide deformylase [Jannaschia marina]